MVDTLLQFIKHHWIVCLQQVNFIVYKLCLKKAAKKKKSSHLSGNKSQSFYKALCDLYSWPVWWHLLLLPTPLPPTHTHTVPALLAFWVFLEHSRRALTRQSLHWLFPLLGMLSPRHLQSSFLAHLNLCSNTIFSAKSNPTTLPNTVAPSPSLCQPPFLFSLFFTVLITF